MVYGRAHQPSSCAACASAAASSQPAACDNTRHAADFDGAGLAPIERAHTLFCAYIALRFLNTRVLCMHSSLPQLTRVLCMP